MWSSSDPIGRSTTPSAARHWRTRAGRHRLVGNVCESCALRFFPARMVCPTCHRRDLTECTFAPVGTVEVSAVDHTPLIGHAGRGVRPFAIVRLESGPAVLAELVDVDADEIRPGMRVEAVIRKWRREANGLYCYGFKFRPVVAA